MSKVAQRFVILSAPRSGSNMLCTLLNSHSDILCHHEVFNPRGIFYALPLRDTAFCLGNIANRDAQPLVFLDKLWQHNNGHSHVGCKMTHRQNPVALKALLGDTNIKKIILQRSNRIKTHVSRLIAEQRDIWEDYRSTSAPDLPIIQVNLDLDELHNDIVFNENYYQDIQRQLHDTGQRFCSLEYETAHTSANQHKVLSFLGLEFQPMQVTSRKQNPDDLKTLIKNFDQIAAQLDDAQLARELRA